MDWFKLDLKPVAAYDLSGGGMPSGQESSRMKPTVSPRLARQAFRRTWAGWGMTRYGRRSFGDRAPAASRSSLSANAY